MKGVVSRPPQVYICTLDFKKREIIVRTVWRMDWNGPRIKGKRLEEDKKPL